MGFWVLTRYDDVAGMLRDARFGRKGFDTLLQARFGEAGFDLSMLFRDPPDHTRLRALVSKAFTPRVVEEMRGRIQEIVDALLDRAQDVGRMDVIADLAYPLPLIVICEMLGVPTENRDLFRRWSVDIARSLDAIALPTEPEVIERGTAARHALADYFRGLIAERRRRARPHRRREPGSGTLPRPRPPRRHPRRQPPPRLRLGHPLLSRRAPRATGGADRDPGARAAAASARAGDGAARVAPGVHAPRAHGAAGHVLAVHPGDQGERARWRSGSPARSTRPTFRPTPTGSIRGARSRFTTCAASWSCSTSGPSAESIACISFRSCGSSSASGAGSSPSSGSTRRNSRASGRPRRSARPPSASTSAIRWRMTATFASGRPMRSAPGRRSCSSTPRARSSADTRASFPSSRSTPSSARWSRSLTPRG